MDASVSKPDLEPPKPEIEPSADLPAIELGVRPVPAPEANNYGVLAQQYGIDSAQVGQTTDKLAASFASAAREALKSSKPGLELDFLATLESDKGKNKVLSAMLKNYLATFFETIGDSAKEFKSLRKQVKKAKNLTDILHLLAGYPETSSSYEDVTKGFSNCMSMLLYGQGNLQVDRTKAFLRKATLNDETGAPKPLAEFLNPLIGESVAKFDAQANTDQALAARITSDLVMQSGVTGVDLGAVLKSMQANRPASAEGMSNLDKKGIDVIKDCLENLQSKTGELADARVKKEIVEIRIERNATRAKGLEEDLKAIGEEVKNINSRIATFDRTRKELQNKKDLRTITSDELNRLSDLEGEIATLKAESSELQNRRTSITSRLNQLTEGTNRIEDDSSVTEEEALLKTRQLKATLEKVLSFVKFKIEAMTKAGTTVKLSDYTSLTHIEDLFSTHTSAADLDTEITKFLTEANKLQLIKDLTDIQMVLTDTRDFTPEEFSLSLLIEYYAKENPDITRDTAKLMAAGHYVRMQKEMKIQAFRANLLEKRAGMSLKGADKVDARKLITLVARDRVAAFRDPAADISGSQLPLESERAALEGISPEMSLADLREYINREGISLESLQFMMYNLMSFYIPRQVAGGKVVLKDAKEIARIEHLVGNLMKYVSEYAALNVLDQSKKIEAQNTLKTEATILAEALKAYQTEFEARENEMLVAAGHKKSNVLSKAMMKKISQDIWKTAKAEKWSYGQIKEALENAGLEGLADGPILRKKGFRIGANVAKWVASPAWWPLKLALKDVVWDRMAKPVYRNAVLPLAKTVRKVPGQLGAGVKWVGTNPIKAVKGLTVGTLAAAGAAVTLPLGIPAGLWKSIKGGVKLARDAGTGTIDSVIGGMRSRLKL